MTLLIGLQDFVYSAGVGGPTHFLLTFKFPSPDIHNSLLFIPIQSKCLVRVVWASVMSTMTLVSAMILWYHSVSVAFSEAWPWIVIQDWLREAG